MRKQLLALVLCALAPTAVLAADSDVSWSPGKESEKQTGVYVKQ